MDYPGLSKNSQAVGYSDAGRVRGPAFANFHGVNTVTMACSGYQHEVPECEAGKKDVHYTTVSQSQRVQQITVHLHAWLALSLSLALTLGPGFARL